MEIRGIAKGDKELRHFTFDDGDYTLKGGVYYYKVNYGKNKLEGEYAEDEIAYIECDKVIPLGGKKPRPIIGKIPGGIAEPVKPAEPVKQPAKRGRPAKVKKVEASTETVPVAVEGTSAYEYYVAEMKITDTQTLQDGLNELGEQGWELCCYDVDRSLFSNVQIRMIFKRKRG